MSNIKEELISELVNLKGINEEEIKDLENFIENILVSLDPVYTYLNDLENNKEKISEVISIIDLLKNGKVNDN